MPHPPHSQSAGEQPQTHMRRAPARLRLPFETLRREIDRFIQEFDHAWAAPTLENIFTAHWPETTLSTVMPAVDIVERDAAYEVRAELPGLNAADVEVTVAGGVLRIKGEKREQAAEAAKGYIVHERHFGAFERAFRLPEGVDAAKIEGAFKDGVLTVVMPKMAASAAVPTKIAIRKD